MRADAELRETRAVHGREGSEATPRETRSVAAPSPDMPAGPFNDALWRWFASSGRRLPLREVADPWRILVAEVMSQQTQFGRALARAEAFCARFPSPAVLAAALPADAIRAWAGLGYNRRAVSLHRAAEEIVRLHGGAVPADVAALEGLPGVGPYTARAVAAQAFGVPVGPVDVNIARVLARLAGGRPSRRHLQETADALVDARRPGRWVHAMMDLSALVCLPRGAPLCAECPIRAWCRSADIVEVDRAPRRPAKPFPSTRRWLRGTLVRELGNADRGAWMPIVGSRGSHDGVAVEEAIVDLERDGLLERNGDGAVRLAERHSGRIEPPSPRPSDARATAGDTG
jgi:A/G-specific adenine glycosylase